MKNRTHGDGHRQQSGKQPRIFYGWYIIAVGMAGAFLSSGTSQLFMSIMLKPLTAEFGWSRTAATGAISTGTILAGLLALPFGTLADRYGPRVLTSLGALVTAAAYALITTFTSLWEFYAFFVIARVVSTNTVSSVTPRTAAVNWFRRFRGRVLGLLSMSTPLGSSLLAIVAQLIMERHGWRIVFMGFAVAMLLLQALPAALILRRRPEDLGLRPDGDQWVAATADSSGQSPVAEEFSWTVKEAICTPALWYLIASTIVVSTMNAGIGFHLVAYFTDVGIVATVAVGALSVYGFTGAMANVIWGFLSERISERLLAVVVMLLTALAILYLQSVSTVAGAFIFAVLFGLTTRGEGTLVNIILAQYYGRGSFGAISGLVFPFNMVGLGIGPLLSSLSFDLTGSYQAVFNVYIAAALVAAALLWMAKKPARPSRQGIYNK
jgi:sugar phosphate permease